MTYPAPEESEITPAGWVVAVIFFTVVAYLLYRAAF